MARPTDYTPELLESAKKYILYCEDAVPTVAGFALALNISRETVYAWCKVSDKSEFSDIVDNLMANQERKLVLYGLSGKFNPTITKLMLSKHGYRESSDVTTNGKDLPQPIMNLNQDDGTVAE